MTTPHAQIRASMALTHAYEIGERLLQADKCNPAFKLSDLQDDDERGIYIDAAASFLLDQAGRVERTEALNQCRAHGHALKDREAESIAAQAKRDIEFGGDPFVQAFMTTNPKHCAICKEILICNAVDVLVTENLKGRAHGLCCAKRDDRFEFINEFTYKLLEVSRG